MNCKICGLINKKNICTIPLKLLTDNELVNYPIKIDTKFICTFEADLSKLFESNKLVTAIADPDAKIIWHNAPFIHYEQLKLNDNFRQYLETSIISRNIFRMGIQKTLFQK